MGQLYQIAKSRDWRAKGMSNRNQEKKDQQLHQRGLMEPHWRRTNLTNIRHNSKNTTEGLYKVRNDLRVKESNNVRKQNKTKKTEVRKMTSCVTIIRVGIWVSLNREIIKMRKKLNRFWESKKNAIKRSKLLMKIAKLLLNYNWTLQWL
jgi:hypothetical protein